MSRDTKAAPIRSNIVLLGWNFEEKNFRPICGQLSKISSQLCTWPKIEAKRLKQRFPAGRSVGCGFPNFQDFTKKFKLREIFWHTFDKFWPFGCRGRSKRKKTWPDFEGLPGASRWFVIHETSPKIFFCPKTTKYHKDSHLEGPAKFQTLHRSWVVFDPFWPAVPKPLALGALGKGHPKYLFGATKWPPKHYGGASLTDFIALGKITT